MNEQKIAPVLSDDEISRMGETIRDEQYNEFCSWGQGYRRDSKGSFTIPLLPHILPRFARAIEQAVLARVGAVGYRTEVPSDGWLQDAGLLYRLTDERRPQNRDEINVTMADGSRSPEARTRRAGELLDSIRALKGTPAAAVAEPEWIDDPHDIEQGMIRNPKYVAPAAAVADAHPGCVMVPLHPTRAMEEVMQQDDWQWRDVLAAAKAVTESQYEQAAPQPSSNPGPLAEVEPSPTLPAQQRKEFIRRASFISEGTRDERAGFVDEIADAAIAASKGSAS